MKGKDVGENWLSIVEYARINQLSDMTVRRRIKTGRLQAILHEGKYYIEGEPPKLKPSKPVFPKPYANLDFNQKENTTIQPWEDVLKVCEGIADKLETIDDIMMNQTDQKIEVLEAKIQAKDCELLMLKQKLEDLQMLIKMLESDLG